MLERIITRKIFSGGKEVKIIPRRNLVCSCFRHFGERRVRLLELPPPHRVIVD
jgi:hypothetical protein